jgi:hypothetical protein
MNLTFALNSGWTGILDEKVANTEPLIDTFAADSDAESSKSEFTVDESLTLQTQKSSQVAKIVPWVIQEKLSDSDNLDEREPTIVTGTQEAVLPQIFTSDDSVTQAHTLAEPIDFSNIDFSTALTSIGDTTTLFGQENTTIEIPDGDSREEYTPPIPGTDVDYSVSFWEESSSAFLGQTQSTTTQNTYTCTVYVGYTCSYNLPIAYIRQYNMSNPSVASVAVGSTSFTITGNSPGSSTLSVNYAGRTIATVYITVEQMIVPIGANYGTNTLEVGQSTYLVIRSGNGGYIVSSSNNSVVSVSGNDTNWTLSALTPGTATITYRDSVWFFGTINMTVTAPPRDLVVSVGQTTLEQWMSNSLTITDGNGGYTVSSSNPSVLSVSGNGTNWRLSWVSVGSSTVTVRDSRWKVSTIPYTVIVPGALKTLRVSYTRAILYPWQESNITILDGNGGYTMTSSNPSVLTVDEKSGIATAKSGW